MTARLLRFLFLGSLFLIPLVSSTSKFGFEQAKVIFFIFSMSLIGFIWLWKKPELKWDLINLSSSLFLLSLFVTSILGIDPRISFLGRDPYYQGWILYAYLFLFSLIVSQIRIKLESWACVLTGSALIVSFLAIKAWILLNLFNIPVSTYAGRVISSFGQPNFYAGFLLMTLPFSYYLLVIARSRRRRGNLSWKIATLTMFARDDSLRLLGWISGLVSLISILVSYSRSTILLAFLLLVLGLVDQLKIKLKVGLVVMGIVIISILLALKFSSGIIGNEISRPILTKNPDLTRESVEKRAYIWPESLKIIVKKPLTGYGLENIGGAFAEYFEVNKHLLFEENLNISPVLISLKELNIDRSHNYILDLLLFSGGIGFLAWIFLVGLLFWKLIQDPDDRIKGFLLVSLVTYLVWIQFQNQSIVHLLYFWLLVGITNQDKN